MYQPTRPAQARSGPTPTPGCRRPSHTRLISGSSAARRFCKAHCGGRRAAAARHGPCVCLSRLSGPRARALCSHTGVGHSWRWRRQLGALAATRWVWGWFDARLKPGVWLCGCERGWGVRATRRHVTALPHLAYGASAANHLLLCKGGAPAHAPLFSPPYRTPQHHFCPPRFPILPVVHQVAEAASRWWREASRPPATVARGGTGMCGWVARAVAVKPAVRAHQHRDAP